MLWQNLLLKLNSSLSGDKSIAWRPLKQPAPLASSGIGWISTTCVSRAENRMSRLWEVTLDRLINIQLLLGTDFR